MTSSGFVIILAASTILSAIICILNLVYVAIVKGKFRWIKLVYAINNGIVTYILYSLLLDDHSLVVFSDLDTAILVIWLLQITLLGGTLVSFSKLRDSGISVSTEVKKLFTKGN